MVIIAYKYKGYNPANNKHVQKYSAAHYQRITLNLNKAYYEQDLKPLCDRLGVPVATFIKSAIQHEIERYSNQ